MNRKDFIKNTSLAAAGIAAAPFSILKGNDDREVNVGFIGVGARGSRHLSGLLARSDVKVPAICDIDQKNANKAKKMVEEAGQETPDLYTKSETDFERMVARDDLDAVLIATPWRWHVPSAVAAMEAGKYVGLEVPAAYTVEDCWDLVDTSESTGQHCMFLENVCYRRDVMAILNMVRQGLFGELIHARCGYEHNLLRVLLNEDGEFGSKTRGESAWRTEHHIKRNGDLYPTHGIGPVAHWLDINRGNRFVKLTSTATKARGLNKTIKDRAGENSPNADIEFKHGDVVTSTITTANGESIIVTNNTTLPKPYSLGFRCQGTNGLWQVDNNSIYLKDKSPNYDQWESFDSYQDEYDSSMWKKHEEEAAGAGHGGMDWFMRNSFVESVKDNVAPPIDVYDAAAWSVIGPLSEASIAKGGDPVEFPDFTSGRWLENDRIFDPNAKY